ncbi:hypothetical protein M422DRAFT_38771, partial [Sphaerobolus stellatus SS14]
RVDGFLIAICLGGGGVGEDDGAHEDVGVAVDVFCDRMDGGKGHGEGARRRRGRGRRTNPFLGLMLANPSSSVALSKSTKVVSNPCKWEVILDIYLKVSPYTSLMLNTCVPVRSACIIVAVALPLANPNAFPPYVSRPAKCDPMHRDSRSRPRNETVTRLDEAACTGFRNKLGSQQFVTVTRSCRARKHETDQRTVLLRLILALVSLLHRCIAS